MNPLAQPDSADDLPWTGERYLPSISGAIGLEHVHRYLFAAEFVSGKAVLDIACGEGYGSAILAARATRVIGMDLSAEAVAHARRHHVAANLEFRVGDCTRIPLDDACVDCVISFETLEHHERHDEMLGEFRRVLRPGGIVCLSTPDHHEYTVVLGNNNDFHVKELGGDDFHALVLRHFAHLHMYGQRVVYGSNIAPLAADAASISHPYVTYHGDNSSFGVVNGVARPVYLVAVASDGPPAGHAGSFHQGAYGALQEKEERIAHQSVALQDSTERIASLERLLADHALELARLGDAGTKQQSELTALAAELEVRERHNEHLAAELRSIHSSNSWRATAPLRWLRRVLVTKPVIAASRISRKVWRNRRPASDATATASPVPLQPGALAPAHDEDGHCDGTKLPGKLVVVTHDAHPHGAQYLALALVTELVRGSGAEVEVVCLGHGALKAAFAAICQVNDLADQEPDSAAAGALAAALHARGFRHAIVNTTVSGGYLSTLARGGLTCISLVHEMRGVIDRFGLHAQTQAIATHARWIVFPAPEVQAAFESIATVKPGQAVIRPQGLYKRSCADPASRTLLRARLGIPADAGIVLGIGFADHRKGADLFAEMAMTASGRDARLYFVWVGNWGPGMQEQVQGLTAQCPHLQSHIRFVGHHDDTSIYFAGADIFALTSREDPFPAVVQEAMQAGLPVIAFARSSGCNSLIAEVGGINVEPGDCEAFVAAILDLFYDAPRRALLAAKGRTVVMERFGFRTYVADLLYLAGLSPPRVTVVVPNYNYARYLPERIASILGQSHPIFEIVFLDDASTDESVAVARQALEDAGVDCRVVINDKNSGSVSAQWLRGAALARGEFVWIAEADDRCGPDFLATVLPGFARPEVVLSYCQSRQIDGEGNIIANDYLDYVADLDDTRWSGRYEARGDDEIRDFLAVKNTIPNVSAVLFRRGALLATLRENMDLISSHRTAGDWVAYVIMLANGTLAYSPLALNDHRRHAGGATIRAFGAAHLREIKAVQDWIAATFGASPAASRAAANYLEQLRVQFGLAPGFFVPEHNLSARGNP